MPVPVRVRVEFGHAAVQVVANELGVDLLHIKGVATDQDLTGPGGGTDADILVRPEHVQTLLPALRSRGWEQRSRFLTGSPFGHAVEMWHAQWGYADLHRFFPGMQGQGWFDALSDAAELRPLAAIACRVPNRAGRVLVHVLNGVRNGHLDVTREEITTSLESGASSWAEFDRLVISLDASLALDAALGELDHHRGEPSYDLWRVTLHGGTRTQEWAARVKAAPSSLGEGAPAGDGSFGQHRPPACPARARANIHRDRQRVLRPSSGWACPGVASADTKHGPFVDGVVESDPHL